MWQEILSLIESGGWIMLPLALVSIASWYWMLCLFKKLYFSCRRSAYYEREITERLIKGEGYGTIRNWLHGKPGIVPKIVHYSLDETNHDYHQVKFCFDEARSAEINLIDKEFGVLKSLTKTAPLLGLLGTVIGMVETFNVFGLGFLNGADLMALGISKALVTTQIGLLVALPGIFGIQYLKGLRDRLDQTIGQLDFHLKSLNIKQELSQTAFDFDQETA